MDSQNEAKRLVDAYVPLIMRIGYTYLKSKEDAEDIAQETLIKLVRHEQSFSSAEHEKAWVTRVAINACKNVLKSAARTRSVKLEDVPEPATGPEYDVYSCGQSDRELDVLDAVQSLPETYREPIFLYYSEGYAIQEIADMTGKSKDAIAKNLSRGRKMLREMLGVEF